MCACNTAHAPSGILARGPSAPVASPGQELRPVDPTEAFSLWTPDQGGPSCPPLEPPDRGSLRCSLWPPIDQACAAMDLREGASPPPRPLPSLAAPLAAVVNSSLTQPDVLWNFSMGRSHGAAQRQREKATEPDTHRPAHSAGGGG